MIPGDDADTVVLVPILRRAHRVAPLVASLRATSTAAVLFLCTPDDAEVLAAVERAGCPMLTVPYHPHADYARKLNTGYRATTQPLLFLGADDLEFRPGWLPACRAKLTPGVGVIGTNDGANPRVLAGTHSTHSLVTRAYADTFGTIDGPGQLVTESYPHEYVDDELVGTAKKRGAYAHAADAEIWHHHPNWDASVPMDEWYAGQNNRLNAGRRIYHQRRRRWM